MTETITSRQNQFVRRAAALSDRGERARQKRFAFEGLKLFGEAVSCSAPLEEIYAVGDIAEAAAEKAPEGCRVFRVTPEVYDRLSQDRSPDGIYCVCGFLDGIHTFGRYGPDGGGRKFICASVRDPGNIGTIVRSARAFGVDQLVLSADCADIYNIKTVRAAMGALFAVRIHVADDIAAAIEALGAAGYEVCAAVLNERAEKLGSPARNGRRVYAVGNEGHGLPDEIIRLCPSSVYIPMEAGSESLNAAIAASVLMWEEYRGSV